MLGESSEKFDPWPSVSQVVDGSVLVLEVTCLIFFIIEVVIMCKHYKLKNVVFLTQSLTDIVAKPFL